MKVLVTGADGLLGRTLMRRLADREPVGVSIGDADIASPQETRALLTNYRPDAVIHCAAMTAVDDCESRADDAYRVNALGSANVADACRSMGARLIAVSTDYVFSGGLDRPYHEFDATGPRTVYGASKLAGEVAIRRHCPGHLIVRTSWLYGPGGPSFLHTMLRLGRQGREPLKVVEDQVGNPTSTLAVADHLAMLLETPAVGTMHLSCEGETSWRGFAEAIFDVAGLSRPIVGCTTAEFPRPAPRPSNSRLEKRTLRLLGLPPMPTWRETLETFLREYPDG
ncbi:MAG: dTDP-4-dehydrorhamnose reductase [Phycisphaerae bacterium]|nr:dTDP-4-dehydrorhamnose reductase [Phycisphaerae bacterium]